MIGILTSYFSLLLVGWIIAIVVHEFGHYVFAVICGYAIRAVVIGTGPVIWSRRRGITQYELRRWPVSGYVTIYPSYYRRPSSLLLFYAGGVIANAALLVIMGLVNDHFQEDEAIFDWLFPIAIAQICLIGGTLTPGKTRPRMPGQPSASDGLRIIRILMGRGQMGLDLELALRTLRGYAAPGDPAPQVSPLTGEIHYQIIVLNQSPDPANVAAAMTALMDVIATGRLERAEELWALEGLLTHGLAHVDPARLPDLDRWSARALAIGGHCATIHGTRGAVLVLIGNPEDGKRLLTPLTDPSANLLDRFFSLFYLARAEAALGNASTAADLIARFTSEFQHLPGYKIFAPRIPIEIIPEPTL